MPLLLKLAVSVSVLVLIAARVPLEDVLQRARDGAPLYLLAALLLILPGVVLVAVCWRLVAGWLGVAIPLSFAVRAARHGAGLSRVAASLVADRLVGLFGVCLLLILASPVVRQLPPPYASLLAPVAVLASGTVLAAFLLANRAPLRAGPLLAGVVLAAAIPISINGWGVREAAIVVLAAPLGVPAAQALLVSLTLGVLNAIASLPGVAVMLSGRRG